MVKYYNCKWMFFIVLLLSQAMAVISCNKTSESYPLETVSLNMVFDPTDSLGTNAQNFLYNIYSALPQGYNRIASGLANGTTSDVLDAGTDDAIPSGANHQVEFFSTEQIQPTILPDNAWNNEYSVIRKVNIFLANIGVVPLNLPGQKDQWKAEARFMRAMAYFELIKRWGGVPLIGDKVYGTNDVITVSRNSYTDCINYITSELDTAVKYLPKSYNATYYGRVTSGACRALKAKTLLYAASPLNNAGNDISKWQAAAAAAKMVIDTGTYSLMSSFYNVFVTRVNSEVILAYYASTTNAPEKNNGPIGSVRGDLGLTSPTQELVNEFEMTNGKAITDPTSGYDPTNPYKGRDSRLGYTVFYNGQNWLGRQVQTYDGGIDRPSGYGNATSGETRTGYFMSKMLSTAGTGTSYTNVDHDFPIIRYAEILLDYAEAQNEAVGPDASVYNAVQLIRQRAGLNPYTLPTGLTQAQMRARIQHERRVELAFEEQRFWDIRRWKIAETVLNGILHGVQIIKNANNTFTYNIVNADAVSFDASKMYLFPIPFQEVSSNPNMQQNPNW